MTRAKWTLQSQRSVRSAAWLLLVAAALACSESPREDAAPEMPRPSTNIVLILADDLGYGDIGAYAPDSLIPTPHIDQLARDGIRLTDAHSPAPICTPTRYAILTGREPLRLPRVRHSLQPLSAPVIEREQTTLPELLRAAGYTNVLVGKWHLGRRYTPLPNRNQPILRDIDWTKPLLDGPLQHGFDRFFGLGRPGWTFMEDGLARAPATEPFDLGDVPEEQFGKRAHKGVRAPGFRYEQILPEYVRWTEAWIDDSGRANAPFFLEFAPAVPHTPIAPSPAFQGATPVGPYGDIVAELDDAVGRIVAALERNGLREDTLIVFTSDNGPETHAYERLRRTGHASMGPLRGGKHSLFEGGHRVPFIASWPGRIPAGSSSAETVSLVDLMATFAAVADVPVPPDAAEDSHDVLPVLLDQPRSRPVRAFTVYNRGQFAQVRQGPWALLDMGGGGGRPEPAWFLVERGIAPERRGNPQLFDLERDPGQTTNRFEDEPERVEQLRALAKRIQQSKRTAPLPGERDSALSELARETARTRAP